MSSAETRQRLIEFGRIAFAAKGHDKVSLHRDILKPARISNGSFYHQFTDKTDLLVAVLEDGRKRGRDIIFGAVPDADDMPPLERITQRLALWLKVLEVGEDMFRIQLKERDNPDERVRTLVADFRAGSFAPLAQRLANVMAARSDNFDAHRAALFIRDFVQSAALTYLDMPEAERAAQREDLARDMAAFIFGGITSMAGITDHSGVTTT